MVNQDRLTADLQALGQFGRMDSGGIVRPALGKADQQARSWLISRMQEAGLCVQVDGAANIIGRLDCGEAQAPSVIIGSHLDTVPHGGMFDGALGVLAGLECARVIQQRGERLPWHLEVVNFTDEEGHYNAGTFGSRAMLGMVSEEELSEHKVGTSCIAQALSTLNHPPSAVFTAQRPLRDFRAYFELHIEQGTYLEQGAYDVGIVTGIVGIYRYLVSIAGWAGHAGTTPMDRRQDALVEAAPLFTLLPQWAKARSPQLVATIGQLELLPGAVNVIPGQCNFTVELRSLVSADMLQLKTLLAGFVSEHAGSSMSVVLEKDAVPLDESLMKVLEDAAEDFTSYRMPSGAGHDAQSFAPSIPTAMLFVPSRGGFSHCPQEWTDFEPASVGTEVLLKAILQLAERERRG